VLVQPRANNPLDASPTPDAKPTFTPDVEQEANSYFVRVYKGEVLVPQLVDRLLVYKASSNKREKEVCECIIASLLDEFQFFSRYPEKELVLTSFLFGSLIENGVVEGVCLGNALRRVLDAVRATGPLNSFGVQALGRFKGRLGEWPQYCVLLMAVPGFDMMVCAIKD
jgi:CCR4-NOT transcription complex subunit 1